MKKRLKILDLSSRNADGDYAISEFHTAPQ